MFVDLVISEAYLRVLSLFREKYSNLSGAISIGRDTCWSVNTGSLDELIVVIGCKAKTK